MQPEPPDFQANADEPGAIHPSSPLRLSHLMALTAAAALTFAAWQIVPSLVYEPYGAWGYRDAWEDRVVLSFYFWSPVLSALLLAGPCERRRLSARSYGTAAAAATSAALAFSSLTFLAGGGRASAAAQQHLATLRRQAAEVERTIARAPDGAPMMRSLVVDPSVVNPWYSPLIRDLAGNARGVACAVVGAWSILALTGIGRRPRGWPMGSASRRRRRLWASSVAKVSWPCWSVAE